MELQNKVKADGGLNIHVGLGVGCSVFNTKGCAVDQSGMQSLYDAYLRVFEMVDHELRKPTQ